MRTECCCSGPRSVKLHAISECQTIFNSFIQSSSTPSSQNKSSNLFSQNIREEIVKLTFVHTISICVNDISLRSSRWLVIHIPSIAQRIESADGGGVGSGDGQNVAPCVAAVGTDLPAVTEVTAVNIDGQGDGIPHQASNRHYWDNSSVLQTSIVWLNKIVPKLLGYCWSFISVRRIYRTMRKSSQMATNTLSLG